MQYKEILKSKKAVASLVVLAVVVVAIAAAGAHHDMREGRRGGEGAYGKGMMGHGYMMGFDGRNDEEGMGGVSGFASSINGSSFSLKADDGSALTVNVGTSTAVQFLTNTINPQPLKVGDRVTVEGDLNAQGLMDARIIRVLPLATASAAVNTTSTKP